ALTRVLGDIAIGDEVFVGPHGVIKGDITVGSVVTLRSELQVIRGPHIVQQLQPAATQTQIQPMEAS
ncbi:polymer-forming cytoskeletal protein, partial [Pseudomonas aeruginosa]